MLSPASTKLFRPILVAVTLCMVCLPVPEFAYAKANEGQAEDLIRSAMIYNFCKFVEWPGESQETLILGVFSLPGSESDFSSIDGKQIQDSTIEIRQVSTIEEMRSCHLIFIEESNAPNLDEAIAIGQDESILTISEMDDFCTQGGIIQLVHRRGKLRFFINRQAARESQLVLSSQLLKMAKIVGGD
jgi:hypothetical protein